MKVSLGDTDLGTFPVDNTIGTAVFDEYGTASVDVVLPAGTPGGGAVLTVTGLSTGTAVTVPLPTEERRRRSAARRTTWSTAPTARVRHRDPVRRDR